MNKILGHNYSIRNSEVFWGDKQLKNADPETFEVLDEIWAKDKNSVFTYGIKRNGIDISNFIVLNALFAKDKNNVYYLEGKALKIEDPSTFEVLDNGKLEPSLSGHIEKFSYGRDKNNIYCYLWGEGKPKIVRGAGRKSFKALSNGYGIDNKKAFFYGVSIKGVDVNTFKVLTRYHAIDKNYTYYGSKRIDMADPVTFEQVIGFISRDKNYVYYQDKLVENCDPNTIEIFSNDDYFFRDTNNIFIFGVANTLIDANTFELLGDSIYQKDKNHVYCHGELLEGADLTSFQIIDGTTAKDKNTYYRSDCRVPSL